jgi:hypothetical protein
MKMLRVILQVRHISNRQDSCQLARTHLLLQSGTETLLRHAAGSATLDMPQREAARSEDHTAGLVSVRRVTSGAKCSVVPFVCYLLPSQAVRHIGASPG